MKKEKSCGAVTYYVNDSEILYLIEHMAQGHYSLPKGHVEENESEVETAIREIKEETNLDVELDDCFRHVITYSPYPGIIKDVVFFTAKVVSNQVINQISEVEEIIFLSLDSALKILTYETDKEVLMKADTYLKSKHKLKDK